MAKMALDVQAFVASSNDVAAERLIVASELEKIRERATDSHQLLLRPFLWELDHPAVSGDPQPPLTDVLKASDLAIVILWSRLGAGAEKELWTALDRFKDGLIDNVAIYVKATPVPPEAKPENVAKVNAVIEEIRDQKLALMRKFGTDDEFRRLLELQLQQWLDRYWIGMPSACEFALRHSGPIRVNHGTAELRWHQISQRFDFEAEEPMCREIGAHLVKRYQAVGLAAATEPLEPDLQKRLGKNWRKLIGDDPPIAIEVQRLSENYGSPLFTNQPLRMDEDGHVFLACLEWFYFFCSWGLAAAIEAREQRAVSARPYINPIHQYLKANVKERRLDLSRHLLAWLQNDDGSVAMRPVVRSFAAYELGMIEDHNAESALAHALSHDPDPDVRLYCITSLGKLRSRRYRPLLLELYRREADHALRLMISQALCRIIGLVDFEL